MLTFFFALAACFFQENISLKVADEAAIPKNLIAAGFDCRIDLVWDRVDSSDEMKFNVYRSRTPDGPWELLNKRPHTVHIYSDFVGSNDESFSYRVATLTEAGESKASNVATATTRQLSRDEFLDSIQLAFFRYFWHFGHPSSGLAREGLLHKRSTTTTGGTGFGMINIMIAAERGFVNREAAANRLLTMVTFLEDKAERFHGIWSHHLHGATGKTLPFAGKKDNGGDLVESAFLLQGMLTVREYFDRDNAIENELRQRITRLWREAEWSWYLQPGDKTLTWHWSKQYGFEINHQIDGFNECMIVYLLAMASPTYAIPADCYYDGWAGAKAGYKNGNEYFGVVQPVGRPLGGPLFFTHYSFLGLDPRAVEDTHTNYYDNNRAISIIHRRYAIENPLNRKGYGPLVWGLTASQNPSGYKAHRPVEDPSIPKQQALDDGTIAPTAAISAFPYMPTESSLTLRHYYFEMGSEIWGEFGFYDAFNLEQDWVSPSFLAIDVGPMSPMIENHRTGLPWQMFMKSDVAKRILMRMKEATQSQN